MPLPSRPARRRALLLEVLIAMGLFASGAAVLFQAPITLWKMQRREWTRLAVHWEVDRQMLLKMSRLLEQPGTPFPQGEELMTLASRGHGGHRSQPLRLRWHCSTLPDAASREQTEGSRILLVAEVESDPRAIRIQRSLFIPQEGQLGP